MSPSAAWRLSPQRLALLRDAANAIGLQHAAAHRTGGSTRAPSAPRCLVDYLEEDLLRGD